MVNILEKQVQCADALLETRLDNVPFASRDNARDQVERPDTFDPLVGVAVDSKGDTLGMQCQL